MNGSLLCVPPWITPVWEGVTVSEYFPWPSVVVLPTNPLQFSPCGSQSQNTTYWFGEGSQPVGDFQVAWPVSVICSPARTFFLSACTVSSVGAWVTVT